jgi:ATP-dependent HslUV protease ATP-binding subunit HslU
MRKIDGEIR